MDLLDALFAVFSTGLVLAGLGMVGASARAYAQTGRTVMIHLAAGFTLIVAATVVTVISAYLNDFGNLRTVLVVNNGLSMGGFLLVVYSVVSFR